MKGINQPVQYLTLTGTALLLQLPTFAQDADVSVAAESSSLSAFDMLVIAAIIVILGVFILLARTVSMLTKELRKQLLIEKGEWTEDLEVESTLPSWTKIEYVLTDAVPVEEEESILFDHEYDGIRELDNDLPPWWKWGFYVSIVFAVVYLSHYHVLGTGALSLEEYNTEMAEADSAKAEYLARVAALVNESNAEVLTDQTSLAAGKTLFLEKCKTCHLDQGQGQSGPNLTDDYWKHGGKFKDIFSTIKYGVPSKGMISWQTQISPIDIHRVASYVWSLHGTNPPNPKAPEGDLEPRGAEENDLESKVDTINADTINADTMGTEIN